MTQQSVEPVPPLKAMSKGEAPLKDPATIPSSWYLGGTHDVKLLTSVDGDLDPAVLNKVTAVPKDIGEIALSVECMVSHDNIVGDFESDLLAKIATNTIIPKEPDVVASPAKRAKTTPTDKTATLEQVPKPITEASPLTIMKPQRSPSMESFSVPNPLADSTYAPVPNPLAVPITPPDSPVSVTVPIPTTIDSRLSRKRKTPTVPAIAPKTKTAARSKVQMPLVAVRQ
mmetsp:Transcript_11896/g.28490  ORF Transcript_11896/g.28490 Transcript_11896/m.28490 type:complete len:228 (+) Transcript_11896:324-1007(+)|eukprot:CAMPEP_0113639976 /NCGR_PEP_ID=MMETSP0017_2-20120614/20978_1 /TAXON_ID=2856 /ORGANISM="Cylindrotheca closterium" /LENGTH=227 /DNA_ID=CAMNT_0000551229 /DNA_START=11 /DNA_END=694 /DNA_ORIENTATION=+ /assembly_acc=CAM_ASM_000147